SGFWGSDCQCGDLGSRRRLIGVVVHRKRRLDAARPADHVEHEHVEEVHEAEHQGHAAYASNGLLDHVGDRTGSSTRVDQQRCGPEVDEVEANHEEAVHRVGEAFFLEHGDEPGAAVAKQRPAHPYGEEGAGADVDEVVGQAKVVHCYHPSFINLNMFNYEPR